MDDVGSSQWWRRLHECVQALLRFLHDTMGYQMTIKRQSLHIDSGYAPCLSRCVHVLVMTSGSIALCIMGPGNCDESTWKVINIGFIHGDVHEQSSKKLFYILSYLLWSHYPNQWPPSPLTDIYIYIYIYICVSTRPWLTKISISCKKIEIHFVSRDIHASSLKLQPLVSGIH